VPAAFRSYLIHATDGAPYPAYVAVFSAGQLGQYYDVQGTTWTTAPQFDNPDQTVHVGLRTYDLYYEGQSLKLVAWREGGAVYWIRNSLTDAVGNGELLAIAEQTRPFTVLGTGRRSARLKLKAAGVPTRTTVTPNTSLTQTLGSIGGLLTLAAMPLFGILLLKRRRELAELRAQLLSNIHRAARLSTALPAEAYPHWPATSHTFPIAGLGPQPRPRPRLTRRKAVLRATGVTAIAAAGVLGALLISQSGRRANAPVSRDAKAARATANRTDIPAVPVAVLNATTVPGAAHNLAQQLRSDGVKVAAIGNLAESRRPGLWILYAPGARTQAIRLARLLARRAPTIAPIDPAAQSAAGNAAEIVAVST
jgi:LytR cell envelope-related transcriptional attenuator